MSVKSVFRIGGVPVYEDKTAGVFFFTSNMTIDDDGDPMAYGPNGKGRDYLANAGHAGNWWGVVTDSKGKPVIQKVGDPAPGMYVSTTALCDSKKKVNDQTRYVNAWLIPYIALPGQLFSFIKLGELGLAMYQGKTSYFIIADVGGRGHIGEGSPALAEALGIPKDPKKGGVEERKVSYILFPGSTLKVPVTDEMIDINGRLNVTSRGIDPQRYLRTIIGNFK